MELWSQGVTSNSNDVKSLFKVTISRTPFTIKGHSYFIVICIAFFLSIMLLIFSIIFRVLQEKQLNASKTKADSEVKKMENLMNEEITIS